jgi:rubrerythrin
MEEIVTIEEAIKTAIDYETRVGAIYGDAVKQAVDSTGKRVFGLLAEEEGQHLRYLKDRLKEWQQMGKITPEKLQTAVPSREAIMAEAGKLKTHMPNKPRGTELSLLTKARDVETETSNFYKRMVAELSDEGQQMFAYFVRVEEGHLALVQAELDALSGLGFWFDMPEFNLEAG